MNKYQGYGQMTAPVAAPECCAAVRSLDSLVCDIGLQINRLEAARG